MKKQKNCSLRSLIYLIICFCISSNLIAEDVVIKPRQKPVTIKADRVEGIYEQEMEAIGNAQLCYGDNTLTADRMKYFPSTNEAEVTGNIRLDRKNDFIQGNYLKLNLDTEIGFLSDPRYTMKEGDGRGAGEKLLFEGKNQYRLKEGSYTTCPVGDEDWFILADDLKIDSEKEVGVARNVSVRFKGVPILYTPWLDFSYSGRRKTGCAVFRARLARST